MKEGDEDFWELSIYSCPLSHARCEDLLIVLCIHILSAKFSAVALIFYSQTMQFSLLYGSGTLII